MKKNFTYLSILLFVSLIIHLFISNQITKPIRIHLNELQYMGFKNIDELNLKQTKINISKNHKKMAKSFHTFQYKIHFIIQSDFPVDLQTLESNPSQNWDVYYTLIAIEKIKKEYSDLYYKLIESFFASADLKDYKAEYRPWINRYEKIILSFNDQMDSISSMMTELDETPVALEFQSKNIYVYRNFLIIYFNQKVIHAKNEAIGSYPYYKLATDDENYHAYMKDGLVTTILHELLHGLIRQFNYKTNTVYEAFSENDRYTMNSKLYDVGLFDYQEILVIRTLNDYFKKMEEVQKF